jgi:hypothetical protein
MKSMSDKSLSLVIGSLFVLLSTAGCLDNVGLPMSPGDAGSDVGAGGIGGSGLGQGGTTLGGNTGGVAGPTGVGGVAGTKGYSGAGGTAGIGGTQEFPASGGLGQIGGTTESGAIGGTGGTTSTDGKVGSGGATAFPGGGGSGGNRDAGIQPDGSSGAVDASKDSVWFDTQRVVDTQVGYDTGAVCSTARDVTCQFGQVPDKDGCPTSTCIADPKSCPAIVCGVCNYGYLYDANGCASCACAPAPASSCFLLTDYSSCKNNGNCTWLEPGCGTPALAASGCYDKTATNCKTDADCTYGLRCLQRLINPCPQSNCVACGQTFTLCL